MAKQHTNYFIVKGTVLRGNKKKKKKKKKTGGKHSVIELMMKIGLSNWLLLGKVVNRM